MDSLITYTAETARNDMRKAQIQAHADTVQQSIIRAAVANISEITVPNLTDDEMDALRDVGYTVEAGIRGWKISWAKE